MELRFTEKIEIPSVELLIQHRPLVSSLRELARSLHLDFGWHYLLDLTWILSQIGSPAGLRVLDAGAGTGILQWRLADQGAVVISVDRLDRSALPFHFRYRYNVQGMRPGDLLPGGVAFRRQIVQAHGSIGKIHTLLRAIEGLVNVRRSPGRVLFYHQDLSQLEHIEDNSVDMVVSVSALEHNSPEGLERVVAELMRVLKPGGPLLATLTASLDQDWWHEPSQGWCYTERSLKRLFSLPQDTPSNYDQYRQLFEALADCSELRDNLAAFYFRSGDNGMPWGKWDPQYQPVGVCKVKK